MANRCTECGRPLTITTKMIGDIYSVFGHHWELVAEYIGLFQVKQRPRELRLLQGLAAMWTKGHFMHNGKSYRIGQRGIVEALKITCAKEPVGIRNHNYFKQVAKGVVKNAGSRHERVKEDRQRGRAHRGEPTRAGDLVDGVAEQVRARHG